MKVRCGAATPVKSNHTDKIGLEVQAHKKMSNMKVVLGY